MDIPRAPAKRGRKQMLYGGIALVAVVATTLGLRGLKPAAPRVDRAAVWIDSVQQGPLVIEVRGPGTLVPERIRYISAVTAGRVERRLAEPGQAVKAETVLLELSNPDVQLEALESERQLTVAQADRVNLQGQSRDPAPQPGRRRRRRQGRLSRRQAQRGGRRGSGREGAHLCQRGEPGQGPGGGAGNPLQRRAGAPGRDDRSRRLAARAAEGAGRPAA